MLTSDKAEVTTGLADGGVGDELVDGEEGEGDASGVRKNNLAITLREGRTGGAYVSQKKTSERATEERREAVHMMKVKIIHPKRKNPMAWPNSASTPV